MQSLFGSFWELRIGAIALIFLMAAAMHYRGQVRLKFTRQLGDHSTFTAPYNLLVYLFSRAPVRPFLDPSDFPELRVLTDNWRVFREEGLALLAQGRVTAATGDNDVGFHTFFRRGWTRFYLKWYGDPLASAELWCPRSVAILKTAPSVNGAMFAALPAGARLGRHRDPFAGSLRYHLGLVTSNDGRCWIEVDGIRRHWRDGQPMMFDETYVHEAENGWDQTRLVLFCDVERPLVQPLASLNRWVTRTVMRATRTQNVDGEPIGGINRFYGRVAGVIARGKALKARDRRLYYALKTVLIVTLVVVLIAPW
jgi:beta-hydroxylase